MPRPLKNAGFAQGLYVVSATQNEMLGTLRATADGRFFRYGLAGGTLVAGGSTIGATVTANHFAQVQTAYTTSVGQYNVNVVVGATAVTAKQYTDGFLQIYDGAAGTSGLQYQISGHATSAGSAAVAVTLRDPIVVATIATTTMSLIPNTWSSCTHAGTLASSVTGVAVVAATSGQYTWLQVGGIACCKTLTTTPLGTVMYQGTNVQELTTAAGYTSPYQGYALYAAVADKWCPVMLTLN
jgi:hypothetical protein